MPTKEPPPDRTCPEGGAGSGQPPPLQGRTVAPLCGHTPVLQRSPHGLLGVNQAGQSAVHGREACMEVASGSRLDARLKCKVAQRGQPGGASKYHLPKAKISSGLCTHLTRCKPQPVTVTSSPPMYSADRSVSASSDKAAAGFEGPVFGTLLFLPTAPQTLHMKPT